MILLPASAATAEFQKYRPGGNTRAPARAAPYRSLYSGGPRAMANVKAARMSAVAISSTAPVGDAKSAAYRLPITSKDVAKVPIVDNTGAKPVRAAAGDGLKPTSPKICDVTQVMAACASSA